jgi:murein DD-endopeptidase MepM/ murein hydrolase activator NlpD
MSNVVKAGRGPSHFRAAIQLTCACVLLGGCSASSERFSSWSMDSGYEPGPARNSAAPPQQNAASYPARPVQQAIAQPQPQSGFQLASANPSQNAGYMQVSRVNLPPLPRGQTASGTKMADGYGPYNPPPVTDGTYTGPRVYTPYDAPANGAPPPQGYYGQSDTAPVYPKSDARIYEQPVPGYRDQPPYGGERAPGYGARADRDVYPPQPAWRGRGEGEVVRVQPGDTLYSIARRFGVTVDMIARANNLSTVYVRPGTELFIPRADPASYGRGPAGGPAPQPAACAAKHCHVVKPGETAASIARAYGVTGKQIAEANNLVNGTVKAGQTIAIPDTGHSRQEFASAAPTERQAPAVGQGFQNPAAGLAGASPKPQNAAPAGPAKPAPEIRTAELTPLPEPQCDAALANPLPRMGNTFRKPVEGKTIAQFGPQRDGTVNEGVTISVPKGTPIKAAENGVVAYVGDELPGFGNLILIRHADEYVTAYAHADTVLVKKCDVVKRGQTVATAGTTGDASQPELHFEIRKNSKPVDPGPLMGS